MAAFQFFDPGSDEYLALQNYIQQVEYMVLDEDQINAGFSLYDIEMALESNPDFYSFFERADGLTVTKFDIERKLNEIKQWIYSIVRQKAVGRKFQRPM